MGRFVNKQIVICVVVLFCATLAGSWAQSGTQSSDGWLEPADTFPVDHSKQKSKLKSNTDNASNSQPSFCPACEDCPATFNNGRNSNATKNSGIDF